MFKSHLQQDSAQKAQLAAGDQACVAFLELYGQFLAAVSKVAGAGEGPDVAQMRYRLHILENRVDVAWQALAAAQREIMAHKLATEGMIPATVSRLIEVFSARVIKVV